MAFCRKCGHQVTEDAQFCSGCGAPTSQGATAAAAGFTDFRAKFAHPGPIPAEAYTGNVYERLVELEPVFGRTKDEIVEVLGNPTSVSEAAGGCQLLQWKNLPGPGSWSHYDLIFDRAGVCGGITHQGTKKKLTPGQVRWTWAIIAGGVLLVSGCVALVVNGSGDPEPGSAPTAAGAIDVCHQQVEKQLGAPSTADFVDDDRASNIGNTYTVTGSVDAENSFGAKIRSSYTCTATFVGQGRWQSIHATVLD